MAYSPGSLAVVAVEVKLRLPEVALDTDSPVMKPCTDPVNVGFGCPV